MTDDPRREQLYRRLRHTLGLTPEQAAQHFGTTPAADAARLAELKAAPMLWDEERVEAVALAARLNEPLEIERLDLNDNTPAWRPLGNAEPESA